MTTCYCDSAPSPQYILGMYSFSYSANILKENKVEKKYFKSEINTSALL